jgi:ammonium transporter, Amt family
METSLFTVNNLWMMVATILVFIMHLGFATLESGFTQSKNTVNILFKNATILPIGIITYALWGFNLMYPGDLFSGDFFGFAGFGLSLPDNANDGGYNENYTYYTDFIFQAMFAATAATIVSGAVAERIKLNSFLIFTLLYVGICYPIVGMWQWGGGYLASMEIPFYDFAGSTIVHSVGGWAALIGVMMVGPRRGKYADGKIRPIPGHNLSLATVGVFLLWFGWFGFNGGSVLSANPGLVSLVFVTTSIAAASGALGALITSVLVIKTNDLTMVLNGILGGLVGITAGADQMSVTESIIIGFIAGIIVVLAVIFFDRLRLDDPVGAVSVHLVCGIWGTLAVGIFGNLASFGQFVAQIKGVLLTGVFCSAFAFVLFFLLKKTIGIRVSAREELEGLDVWEHAMRAYPDLNTSD